MRRKVRAAPLLLAMAAGCAAPAGKGPSTRPPAGDDWVQLTSGEWLHGKIKSMQRRSLDFDSDKLKEITLDWEDVKTLRTAKASCLFGNDKVIVGRVVVDEDTVTVTDGQAEQFPRGELRALSPGDPTERNYWSGNLMLGSTYRTGNTNQTELTAQADVKRRTPKSRLDVTFLGNYGRVDGLETSDNERVGITFDRSITQKLFVRPFLGQYYRDPLQNVAHQATASVGVGYYIFDEPRLEWIVSGGPAYQYTQFETSEAGKAGENATPAFVVQTIFDKELTQRLDLRIRYQGILTSRDAGLFTQHLVGTVEFKLSHRLDLDLSLIWDRAEQPQPNSSGQTPKRNDFQVVTSLGVHF